MWIEEFINLTDACWLCSQRLLITHYASSRICCFQILNNLSLYTVWLLHADCVHGCSRRMPWRWPERSTGVCLAGSRWTWRKPKDFSKWLKRTWRHQKKPPVCCFVCSVVYVHTQQGLRGCLSSVNPVMEGWGRTKEVMKVWKRWSVNERCASFLCCRFPAFCVGILVV